jgi:pyrroloquinoline quinone (PQQ) biosynthesis protein C
MIALGARPLISARADIRGTADGGSVVETDDHVMEFDGAAGRLILQLADRLDGGDTVRDLADAAACDPGLVAEVVETLQAHDALFDLAAVEGRSGGELRDALRQECAFWAKEIQGHSFWRTLLSGAASPETVFGWGIEQFHYVEAANEYMAAAAANCRLDHSVRMQIGKRFADESEHGDIFLDGLQRCGFEHESVVNAPPLPATSALKDYLFELACTDTIATEATFNLMQSSGEPLTKEGLARFYGELTRLYPFAGPIFEAFREHALIDVAEGHQRTIFDALCDAPGLVTSAAGRRATDAVRGLAEHFILFFDNIETYYGARDAIVPRRAVDIDAFAR